MAERWFDKVVWPKEILDDAAVHAASFQEAMQRPITHRTLAGVINVAFVLFVAVFPLVTVLVVNISVCRANLSGSLSSDKLFEVCSPEKPPQVTIDTTLSDRLKAEMLEHRISALRQLEELSITSASGAVDWLDAVEHIVGLQVRDAAEGEVSASRVHDEMTATQYQHYRAVVIFMAVGVVYVAWAIATFAAQGWVANRLWVTRERKKDGDWTMRDVVVADPLLWTCIFACTVAIILVVIDFDSHFDLPGILDEGQFPVPWLWISVATLTSATIFVTAIATQRLSQDFPDPTRAHAIRMRLYNLSRKMDAELLLQIEQQYGGVKPKAWPDNVTHLEVLAVGCAGVTEGHPPKNRPTKFGGILPRVAKTIDPESNLAAFKSLCVFLIALMVATLVFVALGFNVLEGELNAEGELKAAIVASGNAWTMVLGISMSVTVFLIYTTATSRLLPYCSKQEKQAAQSNKGWLLSGKLGFMTPSDDGVALEATRIKAEQSEPTINRDEAYILGGTQKKLLSILNGCGNGGGFHAAFDEALFKKLISLIGLLAPAAAGTILTFL